MKTAARTRPAVARAQREADRDRRRKNLANRAARKARRDA